MPTVDRLVKSIEAVRKRMQTMVDEKGLGHPDVLAVSQQLDRLFNQYNKTKHKKGARKDHIRIEPKGIGYSVVIERSPTEVLEIDYSRTLKEAKDIAFEAARTSTRPRLKVYYLEQQLSSNGTTKVSLLEQEESFLGYLVSAMKRNDWKSEDILKLVEEVELEFDIRTPDDAGELFRRWKI